ncbi:DUF885 family protein [Sphingomonas sp. 1P06PA]|uniref:DUF885 domain-containing protein n=1 Tax=Sphingomonas sp. 1P06PA TaxID=554121 RepID=UPI0039A71715
MDRRNFLASGGLAALAASLPAELLAQAAAAPAAPAGPGDAQLSAAFDTIFQKVLENNPTVATAFGLDTGKNAKLKRELGDYTLADRRNDLTDARAAKKLIAVDTSKLSEQMKIHRDVVDYQLDDTIAPIATFDLGSAVYPFQISQQGGAYFNIPDFLNSQHPVNNTDDAEAYLARLEQFPAALDGDNQVFAHDADRGYVPPAFCLDLALGQMAALRSPAAAENGLVKSLADRAKAKNLAGDWQGRAAKIVSEKVYPALDRQIALVKQYRAKGRDTAGIGALPKGDAIYAMALESATTGKLSAAEIHQMGLTQVAEISAQLDTILKAQGRTQGSVGARLTALNKDPAQLYPDTAAGRADLLASLNQGVADLRKVLPKAFATLPNDPIQIRAVPTDIQDGAPNGYYYPAALDGSRAAIYFINLKSVADWPKYSLPALTYHEAEPGHHLQGSIVNKTDVPLIRKLVWFSAYGEGWALYAESVADELGGYKTPIERAGFLQSYLFRAARLVVDTGIHSKGWSREKATAYMVETTGFAQPRAQREIERYCVSPGQACSYKVGHNSWVKMRAKAQQMLGDKFDLRQFHEVLRDGPLPITLFERRVEERARALLKA